MKITVIKIVHDVDFPLWDIYVNEKWQPPTALTVAKACRRVKDIILKIKRESQ